jgi:transposase
VSSAFVTQWFKKRFDHPGTSRKPNLVPLDKFRSKNLVQHFDFCAIIDEHPDKTVFNFSDEKQVVNKDALPCKIRACPTNGFMDFIPVSSGDFRDAFNLFTAVSANPDKPHPVAWMIGQENGDSHSFVAFVNHLIVSGFIRHGKVVAMDNARTHTGGVAEMAADLLWNAVVDGRASHVLATCLPTRSPELNPTELVFHILARRIQSFKHQAAGPGADLVLHQANKVLCNMDCALIIRCFVHRGC